MAEKITKDTTKSKKKLNPDGVEKLPWDDIYTDFKATYSNLSKYAIGFVPLGYERIKVYLNNNVVIRYEYTSKNIEFIRGNITDVCED